ncbi:hypothetical protein BDR26DRAFT_1009694 [Obelidium mucronatum]|nr:hypothetical protein BDR26DRAFT_1009694 [Obelidium mucronatum]
MSQPSSDSQVQTHVSCTWEGCNQTFESKKSRKEHTFQYHSSPQITFAGSQGPVGIIRSDDGCLHCPCMDYKVRTVGAFKRHAKKCPGYPVEEQLPVFEPMIELPVKCASPGCIRSFNSKNSLAVHVYEYHSSPKVLFSNSQHAITINRDQNRYLHCPCGGYSVLTTAAMLRHAKLCDGNPLLVDEEEYARRSSGSYSPKKQRSSLDTVDYVEVKTEAGIDPVVSTTKYNEVNISMTFTVACSHEGCLQTFETKRGRKEHVFQVHSSPKIVFLGGQEPVSIIRRDDGFLYCPCSEYKVRTVGAFKRHAKKCTGVQLIVPPEPAVELANKCTAKGCLRSFNTKNALAVQCVSISVSLSSSVLMMIILPDFSGIIISVYEYHSNPKAVFVNQTTKVIERDQERYLHCPCGAYSVLTTAAMLRHAKTCDGIPLPDSETEAVRRTSGKYSPKKRRSSMDEIIPDQRVELNTNVWGSAGSGSTSNVGDPLVLTDTSFYELLNLDFDS